MFLWCKHICLMRQEGICENPPDAEVTVAQTVQIGARLRAARLARGLTLESVAAAAGITQGFVSKLERDLVSPSVASLVAICDAVGLRVGELFEPPVARVVRAGEGAPINFGGDGVHESLISPGNQSLMEVIHAIIDPGGSGGDDLYTLACEVEFAYVVRGRLAVILGEDTHELGPGDAMGFAGREPHTWRNASATEECEALWVLVPAP